MISIIIICVADTKLSYLFTRHFYFTQFYEVYTDDTISVMEVTRIDKNRETPMLYRQGILLAGVKFVLDYKLLSLEQATIDTSQRHRTIFVFNITLYYLIPNAPQYNTPGKSDHWKRMICCCCCCNVAVLFSFLAALAALYLTLVSG